MDNEEIARRFNRMASLMEVRGDDQGEFAADVAQVVSKNQVLLFGSRLVIKSQAVVSIETEEYRIHPVTPLKMECNFEWFLVLDLPMTS